MTSGTPFPKRLTRVDRLALDDHSYISENDVCYYIGEYTARKGFGYSDTNNLISNLKKDVDLKGKPEWRYKEHAIRQAAAAFREAVGEGDLKALTFVPIPPSKCKSDPLYDDRLTQILRLIDLGMGLDIREIVVQSISTEKSHLREDRPNPDELIELYSLDESLTSPIPNCIAIVDDVLTAGSHFKAMQEVLSSRFPSAHIIGLFIARRVWGADDPGDFDE